MGILNVGWESSVERVQIISSLSLLPDYVPMLSLEEEPSSQSVLCYQMWFVDGALYPSLHPHALSIDHYSI